MGSYFGARIRFGEDLSGYFTYHAPSSLLYSVCTTTCFCPAMSLMTYSGLHVFNAVVFVAIELPTAPANILYLANIDKHGGSVVCGVSMGWTALCNALGTSLIGYKAWFVWTHDRSHNQRSYPNNLLGFIVEISN